MTSSLAGQYHSPSWLPFSAFSFPLANDSDGASRKKALGTKNPRKSQRASARK